jgi:hypothetical protein
LGSGGNEECDRSEAWKKTEVHLVGALDA